MNKIVYSGSESTKVEQKDTDMKKLYSLMRSKYYFFILFLALFIILAILYNKFTIPVYRTSASILINEAENRIPIGSDELFRGFRLEPSSNTLDNQSMILTSKSLIGKTISDLGFNLDFFRKGLIKEVSLYPEAPISLTFIESDHRIKNMKFTFKYLDNNKFNLTVRRLLPKDAREKVNVKAKLNIRSTFGDTIIFEGTKIVIDKNLSNNTEADLSKKLFITYHDRSSLIEKYKKRLKAQTDLKTGTILTIAIEGTNPSKDVAFLEKLTGLFINNSLDKKNQVAIRTIQFIDDQLTGISDSLVLTENRLQQFRSQNRVMDLSAQGQVIIDQAMSLENERARLVIEANYYNYLAEYLSNGNAGQAPIAPATMGITDPGLTRLVTDLSDLQGQLYSKSLGEKNPLQNQLLQRVNNTKEALRETLNGVRRSNNLAMNEILEQIRTVNAQATALPVTERQLLGIERRYKLNDELYTFLLEKRAEAQIQKASNIPDNELIDAPEPEYLPIRPNKKVIYALGFIAGLGIPFILLFILSATDKKIRGVFDIVNLTKIPVSGHIPHNPHKTKSLVFDDPNSAFAESFRSIRSKLKYSTKDNSSPIILVTSSIPEEGKTFSAINLASAFSLIGKKTLLVDFDMRKPNVHTHFDINNISGISNWLTNNNDLQRIIYSTKFDNLFVIPSGSVPPNPSELTSSNKINDLFSILKERFDCIVVDTSPVGTVSDAFPLVSLSDLVLLIVRQDHTQIDMLNNTLNDLYYRDINSLGIILNDMRFNYDKYSYSKKYSYWKR